MAPNSYFPRVYKLVDDVPKGFVASYGMLASLLPGVTARMVGRALSHLEDGAKTPWHRIVNSSGAIAPRPGAAEQRERLRKEKISFRKNGDVDMSVYAWGGPSSRWIEKSGMDPVDVMEIVSTWRRRG